jgi:hypothetical protein
MEWIAPVIFVGIAILLINLWANKKHKKQIKKQIAQSKERADELLSDENVLKKQTEFERRLDENADLPDGIVWQKAYTYRHLMRKWFAALIAQHRYDDDGAVSKKLKTDWLNYLYLLKQQSLASYLEGETTDKNEQEGYGEDAWQMKQQYMAIEDGFAAAIGKEATVELQRVRTAEHGSFDRSGRKPMAPEGFSYFPVSLNPYVEELKPH